MLLLLNLGMPVALTSLTCRINIQARSMKLNCVEIDHGSAALNIRGEIAQNFPGKKIGSCIQSLLEQITDD